MLTDHTRPIQRKDGPPSTLAGVVTISLKNLTGIDSILNFPPSLTPRMTRSLIFYPFLGGFLGYVLARLLGVSEGLAILGIAVLGMLIAGIGGIVLSRRSRS